MLSPATEVVILQRQFCPLRCMRVRVCLSMCVCLCAFPSSPMDRAAYLGIGAVHVLFLVLSLIPVPLNPSASGARGSLKPRAALVKGKQRHICTARARAPPEAHCMKHHYTPARERVRPRVLPARLGLVFPGLPERAIPPGYPVVPQPVSVASPGHHHAAPATPPLSNSR